MTEGLTFKQLKEGFDEYINNVTIKTEPVDPDESPQEDYSEFNVNLDLGSGVDAVGRNEISSELYENTGHEAVDSGRDDTETSNSVDFDKIRDPRIRNSLLPAAKAKREAFLNGTLKADDLIRGTSRQDTASFPEQVMKILKSSRDMEKVVSTEPASFYARTPSARNIPQDSRSPVIRNSHNTNFPSHASTDNIREALESRKKYSKDVQDVSMRLGADLESITNRFRPRNINTMTSYSSNTRTTYTQTSDTESDQPAPPKKKFENAATQTTKNDGTFTIWDVTKLTDVQRKALREFKKVMGMQDDVATGSVLERIQHRQSSRYYNNNNSDSHKDKNRGRHEQRDGSSRAGSSRDSYDDWYANPAPSKRSKYADCRPE